MSNNMTDGKAASDNSQGYKPTFNREPFTLLYCLSLYYIHPSKHTGCIEQKKSTYIT